MKPLCWMLAVMGGVGWAVVLPAETVKDRKGAVLGDRDRMVDDPRWIYNDWEQGFQKGRETGKPVLVVLRCVPCLACAGIDAGVLLENDGLSPLLDRFVCVRVINANDLDLTRFQFDVDLSFSMLLFNGDGTLYGRYGSWTHQRNPTEQTTAGFRGALEAALDLHRGYPANRESLTGKQGRPSPYRTPVDMPGLTGRYDRSLDWQGEVLKSCVHCHQIGDAQRVESRRRKQPMAAQLIYPFPAPETIGLRLAPGQTARVAGVTDGSPAETAGVQPGDDLVRVEGQVLISPADLSWVLHHAPAAGRLGAVVRRAGVEHDVEILLPAGWRDQADISRRVGTWAMRAMVLGGMVLEDLPDDERERLELDGASMALRATHVGQYGEHAAAKRAGFVKGDILVALDGIQSRRSEGQMIGHLLRSHPVGADVVATVLRGQESSTLRIPMQ